MRWRGAKLLISTWPASTASSSASSKEKSGTARSVSGLLPMAAPLGVAKCRKHSTSQSGWQLRPLRCACRCVAERLGAGGAGADRAEMIVAIDARGVAVGEGDLNGVVADRGGGFGAGLGFEHGEHRGGGWTRSREGGLFPALIVTGGARALISEVVKVVVACVAVGPGDVHAGSAGDVDFHAGGFFARVYGSGHEIGSTVASLPFRARKRKRRKARDLTQRARRSVHGVREETALEQSPEFERETIRQRPRVRADSQRPERVWRGRDGGSRVGG